MVPVTRRLAFERPPRPSIKRFRGYRIGIFVVTVIVPISVTNAIEPAGPALSYSPPTSVVDTILESQRSCDASRGYSTISKQIDCTKHRLIRRYEMNLQPLDPNVELYIFTVDQMLEEISNGVRSEAAARVELQKTFLNIREREAIAIQSQQIVKAAELQREQQERERRDSEAAKLEETRQSAAALVLAAETSRREREAAVGFCIAEVLRRQRANPNQIQVAAENAGRGLGGSSIQKECAKNPDWFRSIADPVQTICQQNYIGRVTCVTK